MPTLAFRRRDPWWGQEGPAARRRHRYERMVSRTAFLVSLLAVGGAAWVWAVHLGFAAMLGIDAHIVIG